MHLPQVLRGDLFLLSISLLCLLSLYPTQTLSLPLPRPKRDQNSSSSPTSTSPIPSSTPLTNLSPLQPSFSFDLAQNLPSTSYTLSPYQLPPSSSPSSSSTTNSSSSSLPSLPPVSCLPYNLPSSPSQECFSSMSAYSITFSDCGDPFVLCYCSDSNMTLPTAIDRLSRVPVGLRRYVGTVLVNPLPENEEVAKAYTLPGTGDIHMFGDTQVDVWVHESMHAYDFTYFNTTSSTTSGNDLTPPPLQISNLPAWQNAIHNDTCAPDNYSTTNYVEAFAQLGVLKFFTLANQGVLPSGMSSECMYSQLEFMDRLELFLDLETLFGNTCHVPVTDQDAKEKKKDDEKDNDEDEDEDEDVKGDVQVEPGDEFEKDRRVPTHFASPLTLNSTSKMPIPSPPNDTSTGNSNLQQQQNSTGLMSTVPLPLPTATDSSKSNSHAVSVRFGPGLGRVAMIRSRGKNPVSSTATMTMLMHWQTVVTTTCIALLANINLVSLVTVMMIILNVGF